MSNVSQVAAPRPAKPDLRLIVPALALVFVAAALGMGVMLYESGAHIPGARTAAALLDRVPLPGRAARPAFVPAPEAPAAAANTSVTSGAEPTAIAVAPAAPLAAPAAQAAAPKPSYAPAPPAFRLEGFTHQWQTWNNCGPATISMAASHFGRKELQAQAAAFLKPNSNDKNVSPNELVDYVATLGLKADWRVAGTIDELKLLIANGIPVVVETWYTPHPNDGMGHYRLLVAYDDAAGRFFGYDSYEPPGINVALPYDHFDEDWKVFDRTYVPVYTPEQSNLVAGILGHDRDDTAMWTHALVVAQGDAAAQPNDAYSWFNVGTNLVALGRTSEAVAAFDRARALKLPWRMLWYQFAPFEAYLAEGRTSDVITLTNANLQQANDLEESHYYKGRALQTMGQPAAARTEYQAAIKLNPRFAPASYALSTLG